ncbi:MAG TPA: prolyl oligopeptidase family serine peptidase [Chloroflexota bacterium]|nr:prolyl oligopeptidase family serine peptidase [Chloroflexota bacterium]
MNRPPAARVDVVQDDYFGTVIEDRYRWMEDWESPESRAFIEEQGAYARRYLDSLPDRDALLKRITELGEAGPTVHGVTRAGGRAFYLRQDPSDSIARLVARLDPEGEEIVLVDPNTLSGDAHSAIDWYQPSGDGRYVAYGISEGGSENSALHVITVETGETLPDAISRTPFVAAAWRPDNRSFYYSRLADRPVTAVDRFLDACVYLHRFGSNPEQDTAVFGRGVNPSVEMAPEDIPVVLTTPDSDWVMGMVLHGDLQDMSLYAVQAGDLEDPARCRWTKVCGVEDQVKAGIVQWRGGSVYLLTHKDAPRYRVIAVDLTQPDLAAARELVSPSERVIEDITPAGDYLITKEVDGGIDRLRRTPLDGGIAEDIPLPIEGSITSWAHEPGSADLLLILQSFVHPPQIYRADAATGESWNTNWIPPATADFNHITVTRTFAPAADGVAIPLTIIHRRDPARDGTNPAILYGYGSYGIRLPMIYMPQLLAWYERGGILAVAGLRGGGEYGNEWHEAGYLLNKHNTIDDFIACAEYLVHEGYTRPDRLAGEGGSAGGIPTGGALVKRPDLFGAMIIHVAVLDALRVQFSPNGVPNIPEFGDVTTPDGFAALQIISSYHKVRDGVAYPAVLLTTGLNDPRIVPWQATKMTARLQAATSSGKPVLLRVETQGGHGMGSTREQMDRELADILAFLLAQFGPAAAAKPEMVTAEG